MRPRLAGLILLAACVALPGARAAAASGAILRLAYTAETRGNLLPCSCPKRPLGGLARRLGFLDSLGAGQPVPLLTVDAGRFFPGRSDYPLLPAEGLDSLVALHVEAARAAGYDAIVADPPAGDPDPRWLRPNTGRLVERGRLRIGIVAVDERQDPSTARDAVRELGSIDLLLLLCSGDFNFALRAAEALDADVIVVSRGALLQSPTIRDDRLYLGPGQAGKYVGLAEIAVAGQKKVQVRSVRLRPMDAGAPADPDWQDRVDQTALALERAYPLSLSQGE